MQWDLIDPIDFRIDNEFEVCYVIENDGVVDMMPYIWFLIGYPGVGKSTFRKEFFKNHIDSPVILSTDDHIDESTAHFFRFLKEALAADKSIVIDRTNLTKKSRKRILDMVPDHYKKVAIVFYCHKDVHAERLASRKGKHIPAHVIESMIKTYDMPLPQEGWDSITYICTNPKDFDID